jgi:hypothetical protein
MIPDTFSHESNLASFSRIFGAMTRYPKRLPSPPQGLPEILVALWCEWLPDAIEQLELPLEMSGAV